MAGSDLLNLNRYARLPICGFCMNAWDIIYQRQRPGRTSPMHFVELCPVGGCDPHVWDYIDLGTGWPVRFPMIGTRPNWNLVAKKYKPPKPDNRMFHTRAIQADDSRAAWRRNTPRLAAQWAARLNSHYEKIVSRGTGLSVSIVPDEEVVWDDEEDGNNQDVMVLVDPEW